MIAEHLSTSVMMEHMRQWLHLRDEGSYCVFVMPSIAAFIHGLLSEDMYATGMIQRLDERIAELNNGQLRLLVQHCETKIPGLSNKTVLEAYEKLLQKASAETDRRHEEEVRGERERLRQLKAAHAGVRAKAWDTSHASLDRELEKFQKFLKRKARRVAEEEVMKDEMEKLHQQLMAVPARRVAADSKRLCWWALGGTLAVFVSPVLLLCLLDVEFSAAIAAFSAVLALAGLAGFFGVIAGIVPRPSLDDDAIEEATRRRARLRLKGYRAEVRRSYEEFEEAFEADMVQRDLWIEGLKQKRRDKRRHLKKGPEGGENMTEVAVQEARGTQDGREVGDKDCIEALLEEGQQGQALGVAARRTADPRCYPRETTEGMEGLGDQPNTVKDAQSGGSIMREENKGP